MIRGAGSSPTATIAELVSSGAGVLAVTADASRRAALANGATGLARFNGGAALIACHRCGADAVAGLAARADSGLALTDYAALAKSPDLASHFEHVVLVDAPRTPLDIERITAPSAADPARSRDPRSLTSTRRAGPHTASRGGPARRTGAGFLHPLFSAAEHAFSLGVLGRQAPSRETIGGVFKALRAGGQPGRPGPARRARRPRPASARSGDRRAGPPGPA